MSKASRDKKKAAAKGSQDLNAENQNKNHNTKKESLGPNTNR